MVLDDKDMSMEGKVASLRITPLEKAGCYPSPKCSKINGVELKGYSLDMLIEVSIMIFHFYDIKYHKQ